MPSQQTSRAFKLFYSYCHKDSQYREDMEKSLSLLKNDGVLIEWSDHSILPGRSLSAEIERNMADADIIVFLLSPDFIASDECNEEWKRAKRIATERPEIFLIPIVLRMCAWQDFLGDNDLKALPRDGKAVKQFLDTDHAWFQVYQGIKDVVYELSTTFTPKSDFLASMSKTDFYADTDTPNIHLQDIFVFLPLLRRASGRTQIDGEPTKIRQPEELLEKEYVLIHGDNSSGKTALGRHLFLSLVEESRPALYVDLENVERSTTTDVWRRAYESQFHGDYSHWVRQPDKTLIMDNLSSRTNLDVCLVGAKDIFERIIVTVSSTVFWAYFRDEPRLTDFEALEIGQLSHRQQQDLIRKRLAQSKDLRDRPDGFIDRMEKRVEATLVDDRVLPRYPFFVLSVIQPYESYMPPGMAATSYGHCYHILIVARLMRAGISNKDASIHTCLNFAEHLAYDIYKHREGAGESPFVFRDFLKSYNERFVPVRSATVNRLQDQEFGLVGVDGYFRTEYMYYFFLGRHLAHGEEESRDVVRAMCAATHLRENYLPLMFMMHHTNDSYMIDEILRRTEAALSHCAAATLNRSETRLFREVVQRLPRNILSSESVTVERDRERQVRDEAADWRDGQRSKLEEQETEGRPTDNDMYRVLKNNEIIAQVLRNKYGTIERKRLEEIVSTMIDAGLRLVGAVLNDEGRIAEVLEHYLSDEKDYDDDEIRKWLRVFLFMWTVFNVEHIVKCVDIPDIGREVRNVARKSGTPAYDIVGYFTLLDAAEELTAKERDALRTLFREHKDMVVRELLSVRTQHYMNTHESDVRIEQSVCDVLGIKYMKRMVSG